MKLLRSVHDEIVLSVRMLRVVLYVVCATKYVYRPSDPFTKCSQNTQRPSATAVNGVALNRKPRMKNVCGQDQLKLYYTVVGPVSSVRWDALRQRLDAELLISPIYRTMRIEFLLLFPSYSASSSSSSSAFTNALTNGSLSTSCVFVSVCDHSLRVRANAQHTRII